MADEKEPAEKPVRRSRAKAEEKPCGQCWPNGWPAEDTHTASCPHGNWSR
jgi:hypothetical protein